MATQQVIRRGILQSFDSFSYTASVLIIEATNYVLSGVPIATSVDGTSAIAGAACAVLFFDESNHSDAVVIAVYGVTPSGFPGRVTMTTGAQKINTVTINSATIQTFTLTGGNIPNGALAVVFSAFFTCPLGGTSIYLAPHGAAIANYAQIGNLPAAGATSRGNGILQLDTNGQVDIQANNGNCTVTLFTYGYII